MDYVVYIFTVIGIGYFITESSLAKPFRMKVTKINDINHRFKPVSWLFDKFDGVVNCIYCCSFWVGLGVYILMFEEISILTVLTAFSCMGVIYVVKNIHPKQ